MREDEGKFEKMGREIGALVDEKNQAYGSSFQEAGKILRVLYPKGIAPESVDDALALTRIIDKLFRIASGHDGYAGESAYRDIAGYGILGAVRREEEKARRDEAIALANKSLRAVLGDAPNAEEDEDDGPHDSEKPPF